MDAGKVGVHRPVRSRPRPGDPDVRFASARRSLLRPPTHADPPALTERAALRHFSGEPVSPSDDAECHSGTKVFDGRGSIRNGEVVRAAKVAFGHGCDASSSSGAPAFDRPTMAAAGKHRRGCRDGTAPVHRALPCTVGGRRRTIRSRRVSVARGREPADADDDLDGGAPGLFDVIGRRNVRSFRAGRVGGRFDRIPTCRNGARPPRGGRRPPPCFCRFFHYPPVPTIWRSATVKTHTRSRTHRGSEIPCQRRPPGRRCKIFNSASTPVGGSRGSVAGGLQSLNLSTRYG